ncbi:clathrin assembly complex beta adaptin component [Suhomyces tanzawaensis NRRL Y-17324]|uniref:Clathrin assembly complex beta adaptin component n=1 Tax=Suhomyces tanzawaensis NRRL Y-17324 TaxID=984487 RepID=A0A1E4SME1_9ASCO|nr:clathrin assembly complex beta adaptin component [Suhomyces tanzawaensis NRRL Y-17324]ODV80655.1 clathrin assembly complex beta adaptin component [Suhomyces tanzawaensis NRRL Y-17324]
MADSFSKISSMLESARDFTIEAAVSASTRLVDTPSSMRPKEISKLLNSRSDRDILSGMRCVISLISRGEDGQMYFADVVKNVTTSNQKIKNLVLTYLIRYAETEPDTALLSINSIQKSLNDKDPINRAKAIRSLAGIRIQTIVPILLLCIKRTISDPSPIVRAATAISLGKVYDMDNSTKKQVMDYLSKLLADSEPQVVTSAIKTYYKMKENLGDGNKKWDPIHGNFRRFCGIVRELDEWAQSFLIELLTEYSRKFLPRPKLYLKDSSNQVIDLPENWKLIPFPIYDITFDKDLELFLDSLKLLVYSASENVILSIAKALYSLAPPLSFRSLQVNSALVRIATSSKKHISYFALQLISSIAEQDSGLFDQSFKKFYVYPTDSLTVAKSKLEILSLLVNDNNHKYIVEELKYYAAHSKNVQISKEAFKAIGKCSQIAPEKILSWCLKQVKNRTGPILNELLTVIRYSIQEKSNLTTNIANQKEEIIQTTYKLSLILQDRTFGLEGEAKASIIWFIGEFTDAANNTIGPDVLRLLIRGFATEPEVVRYQILVLAAKSFSYELNRIKKEYPDDEIDQLVNENIVCLMFQHILQLSKYDASYDTRDRARMLNVLLNTGSEQAQLASLFLQVPKPAPFVNSLSETSSHNKNLTKYLEVSDWSNPEDLPPASVRKETKVQVNKLGTSGVSSVSSGFGNGTKSPVPSSSHAISSASFNSNEKPKFTGKQTYQLQSLDDFFGSDEEEEEEEEEDEEEQEADGAESETESSFESSSGESSSDESVNPDAENGSAQEEDSDADSRKSFLARN